MAIIYLSNEIFLSLRTDRAQRTKLSSYFADTINKLFKNSMKPDINSIEKSADQAQALHCFPYNIVSS